MHLSWSGKRDPTAGSPPPVRLIETFEPASAVSRSGWPDWPGAYPRAGLLFEGDNKDVLARLAADGFTGRIDFAYLDPPFDTGSSYTRKVYLRGRVRELVCEQREYVDRWSLDGYLQFMYERLLLMRPLLRESGVLVLHCDYRRNSHLRLLLDEIFGPERFVNEVVWGYRTGGVSTTAGLPRKHDSLLVYSAGPRFTYNPLRETVFYARPFFLEGQPDQSGRYAVEVYLRDVWDDELKPVINVSSERLDFPTQKPETLLERLMLLFSRPGDLVLDPFAGSGTTPAVAQKLARRWIACDSSPGAVNTTRRRLLGVIAQQWHSLSQAPATARVGRYAPAWLCTKSARLG